MAYSITIGAAQIVPKEAFLAPFSTCSCNEAQRACMPPFVFSVPGQVNFRSALMHLLRCNKRICSSLRKRVRLGMQQKLRWLFEEEAFLGCLSVQPFLYRTHSVLNIGDKNNFVFLAKHLAKCPDEQCACLRRSLLLSVRTMVSPNSREKQLALE